MPRLQYTPELIAFLQKHWNKDITGPKLPEGLGVSYEALKAAVCRLRKAGYAFESNAAPVGTSITYKRKDYGTITRVKTEVGWAYVSAAGVTAPGAKRSKPKTIKTPKPIAMPRKRTLTEPPKPVKRGMTEEQKLANGYVWVWIDRKTKVLRAPEKITA